MSVFPGNLREIWAFHASDSTQALSLPTGSTLETGSSVVTESLPQGHRWGNKRVQGHIIIRGSPSKLEPECLQILVKRNMMSCGNRGPASRGPEVVATLGGLGSFGWTRMKGQNTCHMRKCPKEVKTHWRKLTGLWGVYLQFFRGHYMAEGTDFR